MGIKLFSNSQCERVTVPSNDVATNPNPYHFKVIDSLESCGLYLVEVEYHGCTTFNGRKLILTTIDVSRAPELDPHLLGNGHFVVARFEPNDRGRRMALAAMKEYKE